MIDIEQLKVRARSGDREALQQLRESGYFERKAAERQGFAASHAQKRLWVLDRMDDGSAAYNVPVALCLEGPLDVDALRRSLQGIVGRHESLRTALREVDGEPRQFVEAAPAFDVPCRDLSAESDPDTAARAAAAAEAARPFDLSRAPLVRAQILRLSDARHVLLVTAHHVVFDQWSVEVFVRELAQSYRAHVAGQAPVLQELGIQYKDFAAWQNERLRGPDAEPLRQYWKAKLSGGMAPLDLPADRPRPPVQTFRGDAVVCRLDAKAVRHLEAFARHEGASTVMALAAAVKVLLHRYTGQQDIVIGTTTAGRDRRELADQIGFYVNALALRDRVDGDDTFRAVLARVRATATDAYEHQAYPFDRLIDDLALTRDPSRSPLFDVMLIVNDDAMPELQLEGLRVSWFEYGLVAAKYDLTLDFIRGSDGGWTLRLIYNTDLYDRRRMERFVDHFERVAAGAAADPDRPIGQLELVGAAERQSILEWSSGDVRPVPANRTIADLFEEQVGRTPDAPALRSSGVGGPLVLTYAQLDESANLLADRLGRRMEPETPIAVMTGRGAPLVTALLAVLKRGGTYLPLDPSLPVERLRTLARDAGARVVICDEANAARAARLEAVHGVRVTAAGLPTYPAAEESHAQRSARSAGGRAYVIYTSGSTGTPKGVEVEHHAFVNMINAQIDGFGVGASDAVLQFASCAFDASLSEIFMTLLSGACLVCPSEAQRKDPASLVGVIRDAKVTVATLSPAYIRALGFEALGTLRVLITAGEQAEPDHGALAARGCRYFNAYGPTECAVCATMGEVPAGADGSRVPIGRPIANTQVLVLDARGELQPVGVPGELCVAGAGLARGYLGRPDLTSTSFPAHPWVPGARMYRTGDRARWREDGTLEFLGRIDRQVKVRGVRIEPGEIEAAMRGHAGVHDAAVIVRDGTLLGYIESADAGIVSGVRDALAAALPEYMVPDPIVVVPAFPRSASGKVDRSALPEPRPHVVERTAPRGDLEVALARIWQDVLGVETVGADDRFLDLGGNSMTAILMVSRVLRDLGIRLPIRDVFERGTIASLARALKPAGAIDDIPAVATSASYALSHGQRRLWTIDRMGEGAGAYNIAGAIRLPGTIDPARLQRGLEALAARHESLRTTFIEPDGRPRQVVHDRLPLDFDVVDVAGTPDARVRELIEADAVRPFDLARGPLFRTRLFRSGASAPVFYLNIHHVIADGWSLDVFFRELVQLTATDAAANLPPLPIHYKDFAAWQNARVSSAAGAADRAYWRGVLDGDLPVLELPADRVRPAVKSFRGAAVTFALDAEASRRFREIGRAHQATSVAVWLSLFSALLHRYTEATDLIVGVPATFREHPALEHQIGCFVNMVPLRIAVGAGDPYRSLLARVRATLHDSFEHKNYPYDLLVEEIGLRRDMSRNPLFDVALSIQERASRASSDRRAPVSAFPFAGRTSKFDLTLFASENDDGGWEVVLEYDTDLFDPWRIERMAAHLRNLLRSAGSGTTIVGDLGLMDADERENVCDRWNRTTRAYPRDAGLAALFREVVERHPDGLAVECADRRLTYRELDAAADRLAGAIAGAGPVPAVIPVLLTRSERVPIALLAVLKAGAAYAPIDPAFPPARVDALLADLGATVVLSEAEHLAGLRSRLPHLIGVDVASPVDSPVQLPAVAGTGDNLAYVMYTSGSAGVPKGVLVEQRAVVRLVRDTDYVTFQASDRLLHISSLAFDASTFEIWGALLNGATVCVPPAGEMPGGTEMREWLGRYRPTVLWLTASLFNQLAEFDAGMFRGVRALLTGGERLSAPHVNLVREACPAVRVINGYGPTENTTFSICHHVDRRYAREIPLGRPIANSRAYVLDARLRPVPVGVVGEIVVAGDGVARGYLKDAALTAARFVADPFVAGARAYRTSDRGYWRPDGTIGFAGRSDDQVKVRGYRVEPGEIEAALRSLGASEAVVVPRALASGTLELVAYVVPAPGLDAGGLRDRLRATLPPFMVPSHVVAIERLPLTANGKVDKRRLPEPGLRDAAPPSEVSTAGERALMKAWTDVLGRGEPGLDAGYFDLGGDSIQAIQIASRLRREGWLLRVRDLFQYPTIRSLAPRLQPAGAGDAAVAASTDAAGREAALSPVQAWFFRSTGGHPHFNQSVLLGTASPLVESCVRAALRALWDRHAGLRATFRREPNGAPRSVVAAAGTGPDFLVVDLTRSVDPIGEVQRHSESVQGSFDVASGPLARAVLYRLETTDRLFLCVHHLLVDAVSWRILIEDLEVAYGQAVRAESIDLGPATASYSDWAERLSERARNGEFDAERAYWRRADSARSVPLPYDIADAGPGTFGETASVDVQFESSETTRLLERTFRAYGARVDELLLTGVARAMAGFTGYPRLVVTMEGHGRDGEPVGLDVSRTAGWFTALYPLVIDLSTISVGDDIKRVKEAARRVPGHGIGYGALSYLGASGDAPYAGRAFRPGSSSGPDGPPYVHAVSFNYLGQFDGRAPAGALFAVSGDPKGRDVAGDVPRTHHLDISGAVAGGRLQITITYSTRRFGEATMQGLAGRIRAEVAAIVEHCDTKALPEKTPADFAASTLTLEELAHVAREAGVRVEDIDDVAHLAPMQEGLLYQHRLNAASTAYHVQMDFVVRGVLDPQRYQQAWTELARRHPVLRTTFVDEGVSRPLQVVHRQPPVEFRFSLVDEREYRAADLARPFDLRRAPLWRIAVFQLAPDRHRIVWSYHHILIDGWSLAILQAQLSDIYATLSSGRPLARAPERPFTDFVRWLEHSDADRARAYWSSYLSGLDARTTVPHRPAARAEDGYAFAERTFVADERLSRAIRAAAVQLGVTAYTIVQTAWALVLSRYNDSGDVVFGSIVSGRPASLEHVEETVGLFINAVPVRVQIERTRSFGDAARRLQTDLLEQSEFHTLPLADIQRLAPLGRDLFSHLLVFENYPGVSRDVDSAEARPPLTTESFEAHDESHYDLNLVVEPGRYFLFRASYNTNVHPADWVERSIGHLFEALARACEDVYRPFGEIEILPAAERSQLLGPFQGRRRSVSTLPSVVDMVRAHARRSPDAIAVRFGQTTLSYGELDEQSDRCGAWLKDRWGIGPDRRVALLLDRSPRLIAVLLGVLKAGGAYVPIDPGYPRDRVTFLVSDADPAVVLTERRHAAAPAGANVVCVEDVWGEVMAVEPRPLPPPTPGQLAYVIYTSGSTGRPKGCQIQHGNLAHYLDWAARAYFGESAGGSFGLYSSLAFDLTVTSFFLPLVRGRALHVVPQDTDVHDALRAMLDPSSGVDAIKLTPSHITLIGDLGLVRTGVTTAIVGGEALGRDHVRILRALNAGMAIFNEYGPTETTVGCVVKRMGAEDQAVTIGRPIDDTRIHVVDPAGRLSPIGAAGEICVAGAGVGRGYLGQPALTREKFTVEPVVGEGGSAGVCYRTGDLGRWLPDGDIEYLGRADNQVKIRGHRVEPGEVEAAIAAATGGVDAVVLARRVGGLPEVVLVAYLAGAVDVGGLRARLAAVLPEAFVPAYFVVLDRFPLTANGKVDRAALPDPEAARGEGGEAWRTATERRVAGIWQQVLGVERVGREDKFFALGGHSLKATQIVSRMIRQLGVKVSLKEFFEDGTVAAVASRIDSRTATPLKADESIPVAAARPHYALSPAQHRLWLLHQLPGAEAAYNLPFALEIESEDFDLAALQEAIDDLVDRHESLRTALALIDGEPRQRVLTSVRVPVQVTDLRDSHARADAMARALVGEASHVPFDLAAPPLLRVSVIRMPPARQGRDRVVLLLVMHHVVSDGWSMTVLTRELVALYRARRRGEAAALAPLRIQYKDYAEWQRQRDWSRAEAWWIDRLRGVPDQIALPYDFPPGLARDFRGAILEAEIAPPVADALRRIALSRGATLAHVTLALFTLALYKLSGQADVCIGMSVANRNRADLEGLIGFFVNLVPIRTRLSEEMELDDLIDAVSRGVADALDHECPFDAVVRRLGRQRAAARQPLINVVYAFQRFDDLRIEGDAAGGRSDRRGEAIRSFPLEGRTSKFDVTLFASDDGDGKAVKLVLEYDTGLFRESTARDLLDLFQRFAGVAAVGDGPAWA